MKRDEKRDVKRDVKRVAGGARRALGILSVALLGLGGSTACGNLTGGGFGDLEVVVAADSVAALLTDSLAAKGSAATAQAASPPTYAALVPNRPSTSSFAEATGTLTLRVQVFALARPDRWIEITTGPREVVLPLSGVGPAIVLARAELPAQPYTALRTVFLQVEALVDGGLIVNGVPVRGPVRVDLGTEGRVVVESPVDLTILEDGESRLNLDLHATRWLRLLNSEQRVRAEDFAAEVRVRRQP